MDTKQTPALRFKGFAGEWETKKIGELCTETTETVNPMEMPNVYFTEYSMPAFDNGMTADAVIGKSMNSLRKVVREPSLLVNKLNVRKKRIWNVSAPENNAVCSAEFVPLTAKNADLNFLQCILLTDEFTSYLEDHSSGSSNSQKRVTPNVITDAKIVVPSHDEQKEIGACFARLDAVLALARRRAERLAAVKRAMLAALFPKEGKTRPALRFQGFSGEWQRKRLGDLAQFTKGAGYSKADLRANGTPIILYGRLYTKYETVISDVDTFAAPKDGSLYSKGGEVIVPASGETAEDISIASVVEKPGVLLGGDLNVIRASESIDPVFLAITISHGKAHEDMSKMAQGKTVVHLHNTDLEMLELLYPSLEEQKMIGAYFRRLDEIISLQARRAEKLTALKKALLGRMFV